MTKKHSSYFTRYANYCVKSKKINCLRKHPGMSKCYVNVQ